MNQILLCGIVLSFCPSVSWAIKDRPEDSAKTNIEHIEALIQPNQKKLPDAPTIPQDTPVVLDEASLLENPELLKQAMYSVIVAKQIDAIGEVLPIYEQLPDAEQSMIHYAKAMLYQRQGKLKEAIDSYREVMVLAPDISAARLDLASALYANNQKLAAKDQLLRLQTEPLPQQVSEYIQQNIDKIDKDEAWRFSLDFAYLQENNINNVPESRRMIVGGNELTFPEAESAHGVHWAIDAKKRINLDDYWYSQLKVDVNHDFYWDNHSYDDLSLRAGIGMGYQDARLTAEMQPFIRKRFYGTNPYSLTSGAGGHLSYQVNPHWRLSNYWEWSYEDFDEKRYLNGQRHFIGLSALYANNSRQYWVFGTNYFNSEAKDKEDGYHRLGGYLSWAQEWQAGVSSRLTVSASKRRYGGADFFNIRRKDNEYSTKLSLWHRGVHYWGITPRVVFSWDKTDSNHFYYSSKEAKVNLEFSTTF